MAVVIYLFDMYNFIVFLHTDGSGRGGKTCNHIKQQAAPYKSYYTRIPQNIGTLFGPVYELLHTGLMCMTGNKRGIIQ